MSLTTGPAVASDPQAQGGLAGPTLPPELQKALSRMNELSSLPEVTTRVVEVVEDPKSTAQDMHDIVRNDPALAAKILKVVNSAFYGLPSQIANLDRAIVMLGMSAVKNIALAASLSRLFQPGALSDKFSAKDLWTHCVAVGVCARMLSEAGHGPSEEAFVAGLTHDMGLLIEHQLFPEKLKELVERVEKTPQDFIAAEREIIGADHEAFGFALATKWKFPPALRYSIAYHHNPENLRPEFKKLVTTIKVADTICCQNEIGFYLTAQTQDVSEDELAIIGVNGDKVAQLVERLEERIQEAESIFGE